MHENKSARNNGFVFLLCLLVAIVISFVPTIGATGLINTKILNIFLVGITVLCYLIVTLMSGKIKLMSFILIVIDIMIVILNQSFEMISLAIIIMLIDVFDFDDSIDYRKILIVFFLISSSLFSVILLMYWFFNFNNHDISMWRIDKVIYRKSLGFVQPNVASMLWIGIFFSFAGLLNDSYIRLKIFIFTCISLFIFTYTQSRTSMYVLLSISCLIFLFGKKVNNIAPRVITNLVFCVPILLSIVSLLALFLPLNLTLNNILSGRLVLYKSFFNDYGINLLGQPLLEDAMFDNGYLQSLLSKGILFFAEQIFILVVVFGHRRCYSYISLFIFVGYYLIGFTETALQHFELILPVIIVSMIVPKNQIDKGEL